MKIKTDRLVTVLIYEDEITQQTNPSWVMEKYVHKTRTAECIMFKGKLYELQIAKSGEYYISTT